MISEAVRSKVTFNLGLSVENIVATKGHKTVSAKRLTGSNCLALRNL